MSDALDEAFDRLAFAGFELPNGFVNHGPMACEALDVLGQEGELEEWSLRFAAAGGTAVPPVSDPRFDPAAALGEYGRLPEMIGFFERSIDDRGWPSVVAEWVPVLMPSLSVALFHAAIRTAHATRAISEADTGPRRAELARALGYWAARFESHNPPGNPAAVDASVGDIRLGVLDQAATAARAYLQTPDILRLHGVTGAMAVSILAEHIAPEDGEAALSQLAADEMALHGDVGMDVVVMPAPTSDEVLAARAAASRDPHVVKLLEASKRALAATGDPVFAAAAELVVNG